MHNADSQPFALFFVPTHNKKIPSQTDTRKQETTYSQRFVFNVSLHRKWNRASNKIYLRGFQCHTSQTRQSFSNKKKVPQCLTI